MARKLTRRRMLQIATASAAAGPFLLTRSAGAAVPVEIYETTTISSRPEEYHGWPTIARRANGQLLVSCSGGREAHVCPFGRVELITSDDNGGSWSEPRVVMARW